MKRINRFPKLSLVNQQKTIVLLACFVVLLLAVPPQGEAFQVPYGQNFFSTYKPEDREIRPCTHLSAGLGNGLDVTFGSDESSGSSWGDDGDEDHMMLEAQERRQKVEELLEESDRDFRNKRKEQKWGRFANVTKKGDLKGLVEEEKEAIDMDNQQKAALAAAKGVMFEVLAPKEPSLEFEDQNERISVGSGGQAVSWFSEMDEGLKSEWEALTADDPTATESPGDQDEEDDSPSAADDVTVDESTGKLVARDALAGVRVGSAGGWSLEVFPGDYIVHRKFGIGRFERTCLRPKTKLNAEEKKAQDQRRGEMLAEELKKRKSGVTPEEIQKIRAKFGTEEDTDPLSNPQVTVLEISYADAVVHVPVDRAYRISRYRAGDAVVKPKLSRVRGEAWRKAKQNVEEKTLALAQEVLALYATRETLQRQPFDPKLEDDIRRFEATFPFEPTADQKKSFEDVEADMCWRSRPMDRLVCGDVGKVF